MSEAETKLCSKCKVEKDLSEFNKDTRIKDGLRGQCKLCSRIKRAAYYEANKERVIEQAKAYYEANKEEIAARRRAHRAENKELYAAKQKAYRAGKKEKDAARATAVQGIQALRAERKIKNDAIKSYFDSVTDMFVEELKKEGLTINDIFDIEVVETDTEDVFDVTYKVIED